jgi:small neutral amino acid transporter SnatA (MarC family)
MENNFNQVLTIVIFVVCNLAWAWAAWKNNGGLSIKEAPVFALINLTLYTGIVDKDLTFFAINVSSLLVATGISVAPNIMEIINGKKERKASNG